MLQLFRKSSSRWQATYQKRNLGIFDCLDDALQAIAKENSGRSDMATGALFLAYDEERFAEIEARFSCFGCEEWIVVRLR